MCIYRYKQGYFYNMTKTTRAYRLRIVTEFTTMVNKLVDEISPQTKLNLYLIYKDSENLLPYKRNILTYQQWTDRFLYSTVLNKVLTTNIVTHLPDKLTFEEISILVGIPSKQRTEQMFRSALSRIATLKNVDSTELLLALEEVVSMSLPTTQTTEELEVLIKN